MVVVGGRENHRGHGREDHESRNGGRRRPYSPPPPPRNRSGSRSRHRERTRLPDEEVEQMPLPDGFEGPPLEVLEILMDQFPPGALDMAHAVTCDLPSQCVGALIGRKGEFINYVQRKTGAKVIFSHVPKNSDVEHRTMTVQGPLIGVYAAHMMMMQRYHEGAAREEAARARSGDDQTAHVEELQQQLADIQRQLEEARGGIPAEAKPRKGRGKR